MPEVEGDRSHRGEFRPLVASNLLAHLLEQESTDRAGGLRNLDLAGHALHRILRDHSEFRLRPALDYCTTKVVRVHAEAGSVIEESPDDFAQFRTGLRNLTDQSECISPHWLIEVPLGVVATQQITEGGAGILNECLRKVFRLYRGPPRPGSTGHPAVKVGMLSRGEGWVGRLDRGQRTSC